MKINFIETLSNEYSGEGIYLGAPVLQGKTHPEVKIQIPLSMMNRHGLIAGATGTGKTKTLQSLAGQLSAAGVPVFLADIKGDLSGIAKAGAENAKVKERCDQMGVSFKPEGYPVEFYSLTGEKGAQLRATVSSFGPLLLAKILELNENQQGILALTFKYADDKGFPILDLPDLKAMLNHLAKEGAKEIEADYGAISKTSVSVILRKLVELEQQGAEKFFGEPEFDIDDLVNVTPDGRGVISVLELSDLQDRPALFSTFMLWLLAELYEQLPEVGDVDKPKLVFFLDEAHLLFDSASDAFKKQIEQVVRLIRSKGVGVYFITQTPRDLPTTVLGQLGNRIQHALRAFTPEDDKAIAATARTFPKTEFYDLEEDLTRLGIGEAFVTVLNTKGAPTQVAHTLMVPPASFMGPLTESEMQGMMLRSEIHKKYHTAFDRESAREMLALKMERSSELAEAQKGGRAEEQKAGVEEPRRTPVRLPKEEPSMMEEIIGSPLTRAIGREVVRGIFGMLKGSTSGRRRRY